VANSVR